MKIFVSHSSKDVAVYQLLCEVLDKLDKEEGITRWDVASMSRGESLPEQLRSAIFECQTCIFITTRQSIASPWCSAELGAFWGAGKQVILFLVDPTLLESDLPPQFSGMLHATTPKQLIDSLKKKRNEKYSSSLTSSGGIYRTIQNRRALYLEAADLVKSSRFIRDTTWGKRARDLTTPEKQALAAYQEAIDKFVHDGGDYYEIVSEAMWEGRLQAAQKRADNYPNAQCRAAPGEILKMPMLDLLIADSGRVLISHVSSSNPQGGVQYMYFQSTPIANFFLLFYADAWESSKDAIESRKKGK